jgi:hypothetical protein
MTTDQPILCDMTNAPDTSEERLAAYRDLFADALVARERTVAGTRWRFRADAGVEKRVRDLAALEQGCCAFFDFTITLAGGEVLWDTSVPDDEMARAIHEELYNLPDSINEGTQTLFDRFSAQGLHVHIQDGDELRRATAEEMGLSAPASSSGSREAR